PPLLGGTNRGYHYTISENALVRNCVGADRPPAELFPGRGNVVGGSDLARLGRGHPVSIAFRGGSPDNVQ
ncbi:MAG: hypothetical protein KJ749_00205, partial [Planctomycetes bacterium]|nr:hypothetical protein [Planctomycetota bacterium]